jgi:hypothetical protein
MKPLVKVAVFFIVLVAFGASKVSAVALQNIGYYEPQFIPVVRLDTPQSDANLQLKVGQQIAASIEWYKSKEWTAYKSGNHSKPLPQNPAAAGYNIFCTDPTVLTPINAEKTLWRVLKPGKAYLSFVMWNKTWHEEDSRPEYIWSEVTRIEAK